MNDLCEHEENIGGKTPVLGAAVRLICRTCGYDRTEMVVSSPHNVTEIDVWALGPVNTVVLVMAWTWLLMLLVVVSATLAFEYVARPLWERVT